MNKPILCLTVGISGSGKTTWTTSFVEENPNWTDLNRDCFRFKEGEKVWDVYKFTRSNERKVSIEIDAVAKESTLDKSNIIISDTNLNPEIRKKWKTFADEWDYDFIIKEFPISWEEALKRNNQRSGGVSQEVLRRQWKAWNTYIGRKVYIPNKKLPKAVIADIDGTVADMKGVRGPFEWDKVSEDTPKTVVIEMLLGLVAGGVTPIFLSGRDGVCKDDTYKWIMENIMWSVLPEGGGFHLYMRQEGDYRKDHIVKEELFWKYIAGKFNIISAIDDRKSILELWEDLHIPNIINVGGLYERF